MEEKKKEETALEKGLITSDGYTFTHQTRQKELRHMKEVVAVLEVPIVGKGDQAIIASYYGCAIALLERIVEVNARKNLRLLAFDPSKSKVLKNAETNEVAIVLGEGEVHDLLERAKEDVIADRLVVTRNFTKPEASDA
jgi:hypothetical protein